MNQHVTDDQGLDDLIGVTVRHPYPFLRTTYDALGEDGGCAVPTWRPGTHWDARHPEGLADALGAQLLTLVSLHTPPGCLPRAFYRQQWESPTGRIFGKRTLRWCTVQKYRRLLAGYRFPYTVQPAKEAQS